MRTLVVKGFQQPIHVIGDVSRRDEGRSPFAHHDYLPWDVAVSCLISREFIGHLSFRMVLCVPNARYLMESVGTAFRYYHRAVFISRKGEQPHIRRYIRKGAFSQEINSEVKECRRLPV